MTVFDASALLAFINDEPGADVVQSRLEIGGSCSTVNWAEVAQKSIVRGSWPSTRILLLSYDLRIEPVTMEDAESAASRWNRTDGLSLGDRLCLSLGDRLDDEVLTADRSWGSDGRIVQIR